MILILFDIFRFATAWVLFSLFIRPWWPYDMLGNPVRRY